ncbi:MAG: hypothetical protein ACRCXZ_06000 [Patescibacteria group bacterium]
MVLHDLQRFNDLCPNVARLVAEFENGNLRNISKLNQKHFCDVVSYLMKYYGYYHTNITVLDNGYVQIEFILTTNGTELRPLVKLNTLGCFEVGSDIYDIFDSLDEALEVATKIARKKLFATAV